MKRRTLMPVLLAMAMGSLWDTSRAQAVDLAGVRYEPTVQLGGSKLTLNGAGIRYKAVFKVYTAGLYTTAHVATPEAAYAVAGPRRMHVVMLRDIDGNELGKLFTQGMEKNSTREEFSRSINGTLRMADIFSRRKHLVTGDSFDVDWLPGTGTIVSVNGKAEAEPIKEPEFFNALLSIWLGKSPADNALKDALLGRTAPARAFGQ